MKNIKENFLKIIKSNIFLMILSVLAGLTVYIYNPGLEQDARVVLATFGVAGVLWLTEAVPLFVTSFVIAFIFIFFGGFETKEVFYPFFDPIIVLFLGGFVLAKAFSKYDVDRFISLKFLKIAGNKTSNILLGLMILSALLSMGMSNTASAALLLPIGLSILKTSKIKETDPLFKAFPLAIAYAATTGGLGTIIGSPPNALAVKYLHGAGINDDRISFIGWIGFMLPIVIAILLTIYFVIRFLYKSPQKKLKIDSLNVKLDKKGKMTLIVTLFVLLLWLTGNITGISSYLVALIPIIFFFGFDFLDSKDLRSLNWDTILLFGGGLVLGEAVINTGVNEYLASGLVSIFSGIPL
ncbi:MAG: DASS family sodium-coupled anion symporter, partial [Ignavibacteriae bacterium]|nr:DASS family sodium-coupled anion symporter [Ignavibacteriota bacterium]